MQEELLNQILTELKDLKSDVSEIKSDVSELKSDVSELKSGQQRIEAKLDATFEQVGKNSEGIIVIKYKIKQHAQRIGVINNRVTSLENMGIGAEG